MVVLETERLRLRYLTEEDAPFILVLLNEPSFLQYIGDKGVRTLDDARAYVRDGPMASYAEHGHGLYHVELKATGESIGMCGLLRRPSLAHADIGYSYLPAYWSRGYGLEAARAVLSYAEEELGLRGVVAIASPDNVASARLLERAGLRFDRLISMSGGEPDTALFTQRREPDSGFDDGEVVRPLS